MFTNKNQTIINFPFSIYLLSAITLLIPAVNYAEFISFNFLFFLILCYTLLNFIIHINLKKSKNFKSSIIFYLYLIILFSFWKDINNYFFLKIGINSKLLIIIIQILFSFIIYKYIINKKLDLLFIFFNYFFIFLFSIQIILFFLAKYKTSKYPSIIKPIELNSIKNKKTPNIHFIVFDEYLGLISSKKNLNFSNQELKNFLTLNNFYVKDTMHSNYTHTFYSLSSILNMQYIYSKKNYPYNNFNSQLKMFECIENNILTSFLKKNEYKIINNSIFNIKNSNIDLKQKIAETPFEYLTNKFFFTNVYKDVFWPISSFKFKDEFFSKFTIKSLFYNNIKSIEFLKKQNLKSNFFCYSHILMPHPPFFTNRNGDFLNQNEILLHGLNNNNYKEYLIYTNTKIKEIVNNLNKKNPNDIIIITGDHGLRAISDTCLFNMYNVFFSIRLPENNYENISDLKSSVNIFPFILNKYFNQKIPMIKDTCFIIDINKNNLEKININ